MTALEATDVLVLEPLPDDELALETAVSSPPAPVVLAPSSQLQLPLQAPTTTEASANVAEGVRRGNPIEAWDHEIPHGGLTDQPFVETASRKKALTSGSLNFS